MFVHFDNCQKYSRRKQSAMMQVLSFVRCRCIKLVIRPLHCAKRLLLVCSFSERCAPTREWNPQPKTMKRSPQRMITAPQLMRPRVKEITGIKSVHHFRKKLVPKWISLLTLVYNSVAIVTWVNSVTKCIEIQTVETATKLCETKKNTVKTWK